MIRTRVAMSKKKEEEGKEERPRTQKQMRGNCFIELNCTKLSVCVCVCVKSASRI